MSSAFTYLDTAGMKRRPVDPRGPAGGGHVPRGLGRLVPDPPLLGELHDLGPRLHALLRVPELLRVLDAAAGPGGQLRAADRGLGVRGRGLLPADLLLVSPRHRHRRGHQGVRDQRDRRRGPGDRRVPALRRHGRARLRGRLRGRARRLLHQRPADRGGLPDAAGGRVREVGPAAAAHVAARRDGGPHSRLGADPRGHDGDRRRLPDRPLPPAVRAGADRRRRGRDHRHGHAAVRRHRGHGRHRPQAGDRLLDDVADRLHGAGRVGGRLRRRDVPPDDPRLLQGAAVHGRRLGDRRDERHPVARPDGRLSQGDAVHLRHVHDRRAGAGRLPLHLGLLLEGRDPGLHAQPRRRLRGARRGGLRGRADDGLLRRADGLPRVLRPARARGARAGAGRAAPRRARRTRPPARPRTPTWASPAPSTTSPSASGR